MRRVIKEKKGERERGREGGGSRGVKRRGGAEKKKCGKKEQNSQDANVDKTTIRITVTQEDGGFDDKEREREREGRRESEEGDDRGLRGGGPFVGQQETTD